MSDHCEAGNICIDWLHTETQNYCIVYIAIRFVQNINCVRYNYYGNENSFEEVANHWFGEFNVCPDEVTESYNKKHVNS